MTVRQLIHELMEMPMEADVKVSIADEYNYICAEARSVLDRESNTVEVFGSSNEGRE